MDPDKLAEHMDRQARLLRARGIVGESATMVNHALGGIIDLTGTAARTNQTFGARIATFSQADLDGVLTPDLQGDLADALQLLVYFRNRLEHDQWDVLLPRPGRVADPVIAFGEAGHIDSSLPTIEILASVFESTAAAVDDLATVLTQRAMLDRAIDGSDRTHVRSVLGEVARVSTHFSPDWHWVDHSRRR